MPSSARLRHVLPLLVVVSLAACRKADPEARAQPVVAERPAAVAVVADAAVAVDAAVAPAPPEPALLEVQAHLGAATEMVLHAIDPEHAHSQGREPAATDFHGFPIRHTVPIPAADVAAIATAMRDGLAQVGPEGTVACFSPHHGLRITTAKGTIDLVICFACSQVYVFQGETKVATLAINRAADAVLARYVGETPRFSDPWPASPAP